MPEGEESGHPGDGLLLEDGDGVAVGWREHRMLCERELGPERSPELLPPLARQQPRVPRSIERECHVVLSPSVGSARCQVAASGAAFDAVPTGPDIETIASMNRMKTVIQLKITVKATSSKAVRL